MSKSWCSSAWRRCRSVARTMFAVVRADAAVVCADDCLCSPPPHPSATRGNTASKTALTQVTRGTFTPAFHLTLISQGDHLAVLPDVSTLE